MPRPICPAALLLAGALVPAGAKAQPSPASLPAVVAEAVRITCPNRDEEHARAIWNVMRNRYAGPANGDTLSADVRLRYESVAEHQVGDWDRLPDGTGYQWMAGSHRRQWMDDIREHGYATPHQGGSFHHEAWVYAPLHSDLVTHFIHDGFPHRNTLSIVRMDASGEITLGFCPRREFRGQPAIEGRLVLRADTTLAEAQWRFRTPRADESAGGMVLLHPYEESRQLLPLRGVMYYRKGLFYRHLLESYERWYIGGPPRAPVRADDPDPPPVQ